MTATTTATVEVLTAEVHVLKVGSRQITQSVAKQLDEALLEDMELFGRIRLTGALEGEHIIGRLSSTGALVRAQLRSKFSFPHISLYGDKEFVTICRTVAGVRRDARVRFEGRTVLVDIDSWQQCQQPEHFIPGGCAVGTWRSNGFSDRIREQIAFHDANMAPHLAAHDLPLIVLAGLR